MTSPTIPVELIAPLFSPQSFADPQFIDVMMREVREKYPLAIAQVPGFAPHWIVSKWADLREITRQDEIFHSNENSKTLVTEAGQQMIYDYTGGKPNVLETLVHMDPPVHGKYRAVAAPQFMPGPIAAREEQVRGIARKYIDKLIAHAPEVDFAAEIAFYYPLEVIMTLTGAPPEDLHKILQMAQWFFNYADPDLKRPDFDPTDPVQVVKTWTMVLEFFNEYGNKIIADRRACPKDDIATILANAKIDGCPMSESSLGSYFLILGTAGHDTTAASTATAMWILAEQPELLARLKAQPEDIPKFIEEVVRWATPVKHFIRTATRDYQLRGQTIKKGDRLYLSYVSANRDEEVFSDPFTFNIDRPANKQQIAFGYGAHMCIGQHLAKMELRVFWQELLPRLDWVTLAGTPKVAMSELVPGPKSVPIRFSAK